MTSENTQGGQAEREELPSRLNETLTQSCCLRATKPSNHALPWNGPLSAESETDALPSREQTSTGVAELLDLA